MSAQLRTRPPEPLPTLPEIDPSSTFQRERANAYMEDLSALTKSQTQWLERFQCALQLSNWGLS